MRHLGPLLFVSSLLLSFALAGCFFPGGCPDASDFAFDLRDGSHSGAPVGASGRAPRIGAFEVDGDVFVDTDATAETVTVTFDSDGRRVELRYGVTEIESPYYF